jgi:release factor glutamine methyltransferase
LEENTLLSYIQKTTAFLEKKGISNPRLEAEILISFVLNLSRIQLYAKFDMPLTVLEKDKYRELVLLRSQNQPTAYILGKKNFYGLDFKVNPYVLIPRPETEELVEYAIQNFVPVEKEFRVLDLCCGSGCIGITIQKKRPNCLTDFSDISTEAISVAKENLYNLLSENTSQFFESDLFKNIPVSLKYDLIISNPPYVLPEEENLLSLEVQKEPRIALIIPDFLEFHRNLLAESFKYLSLNGCLIIETNPTMMDQLSSMANKLGMETTILMDLSKKKRFLLARPNQKRNS